MGPSLYRWKNVKFENIGVVYNHYIIFRKKIHQEFTLYQAIGSSRKEATKRYIEVFRRRFRGIIIYLTSLGKEKVCETFFASSNVAAGADIVAPT